VGNHADIVDIGVYHVREREVDEAITARKRNGRHSAHSGQLGDIVVVNVGENDS
jgi:hypothetical protein